MNGKFAVVNKKKYKTVGYFEVYPKMGESVIVRTGSGIFPAIYQRWNWSDSSETPYFDFKEGRNDDVLEWWY